MNGDAVRARIARRHARAARYQASGQWRDAAECTDPDIDPDTFVPRSHPLSGAVRAQVAAAAPICRRCPVAAACLADGLQTLDVGSIRAGRIITRAAAQAHRRNTRKEARP